MDKNLNAAVMLQLENVKKALEKNNMNAFIAQSKEEACNIAVSLMKEGAVVASGGSMSLSECKMMDILRSGKYEYLDREKAQDKIELYRKSFCADYYLCSSNAVTEKGELYNVDGNGNRVSAMIFGPKQVILVVGTNKIVSDLDAAKTRLAKIACPANTVRLNCDTPCKIVGECQNCHSPARICCSYVTLAQQRKKDRIKVIFVDGNYGY